jgi:acyl transferase domain-containing protein
LLLEVSWEVLKNSTLMPERMTPKTGVFIGIDTNDYLQLLFEPGTTAIDAPIQTQVPDGVTTPSKPLADGILTDLW